jgi:hypothetical protein
MKLVIPATLASLGLLAGAAAAAPEVAGPPAPNHAAFDLVDGQWQRKPHTCGTHAYPLAPHAASKWTVQAGQPVKVWINTDGGTYEGGSTTDASANTTALLGSGDTLTIPAMASFDREALIQCVTDHYAPYNVRIVDTEPTTGSYIEAVVGGSGSLLGDSSILGIASADNFCGVTDGGIAFNFSAGHNGIPRAQEELCATVAHEVGHLLSLQHEVMATDLMSYVTVYESDTKAFEDASSACGVYPGQETSCDCGGSTTNSAQRLIEYVGEAAPACETIDDCFAGETCVERGCVAGPGTEGGLGETCAGDGDCASGLCLAEGEELHCVEGCTLDADTCPEDFECRDFEGDGVCWPSGGGGGGGGCASTDGGNPAGILVGLGVALVLRRRRRA